MKIYFNNENPESGMTILNSFLFDRKSNFDRKSKRSDLLVSTLAILCLSLNSGSSLPL